MRKLPLACPDPSHPGVGQVGPSVLNAFQENGDPFNNPSFCRLAASGHPYALRWVAYFPLMWPRLSQPGTGHLWEKGVKQTSLIWDRKSSHPIRNITLLLTSVPVCLLSVSLESLFSFVKRAIFSYMLCPTVTVNITTLKKEIFYTSGSSSAAICRLLIDWSGIMWIKSSYAWQSQKTRRQKPTHCTADDLLRKTCTVF